MPNTKARPYRGLTSENKPSQEKGIKCRLCNKIMIREENRSGLCEGCYHKTYYI